jgi:hypothetical protein
MLHFATLTWAAWGFGFLFVIEGLMFLATGLLRGRLDIRFRRDAAGWTGLTLAAFAMALYPLIGLLAGQAWPRMPAFGIAPCPLAIFTFGLLLLAAPRAPLHLQGHRAVPIDGARHAQPVRPGAVGRSSSPAQ